LYPSSVSFAHSPCITSLAIFSLICRLSGPGPLGPSGSRQAALHPLAATFLASMLRTLFSPLSGHPLARPLQAVACTTFSFRRTPAQSMLKLYATLFPHCGANCSAGDPDRLIFCHPDLLSSCASIAGTQTAPLILCIYSFSAFRELNCEYLTRSLYRACDAMCDVGPLRVATVAHHASHPFVLQHLAG